jgi:hypothetical protein
LESVYKLTFLFVIPEVLNRESIVLKKLWIPGSSPRMTILLLIHRHYIPKNLIPFLLVPNAFGTECGQAIHLSS